MFFIGTVVGALVAVLIGLITLDVPPGQLGLWQDWVGIAYVPPSPPVPSAIYNSEDYAKDFYLLSKCNFTAPASPTFDSTIPEWEPASDNSPPTTAGFFDKVLDTFGWFLVVMVTNVAALLPCAYVIARSLRDRRTKDLKSLVSSRDEERRVFILGMHKRRQERDAERAVFVAASEEAQLERTLNDKLILQLEQVTLAIEEAVQDNLRRFKESQAEKESLTLANRRLQATMDLQGKTLGSQIQDQRADIVALGLEVDGLAAGMKEEEERSRQLEVEKERAEDGMREVEERLERAEKGKKEAEKESESILDSAEEKLGVEREKTRKLEEAKEKAVEEKEAAEKEVARLRTELGMKEAEFAAKKTWLESQIRQLRFGSGRPVGPRQFQQQPYQQWPQPPPPGGR